MLVCIICVWLLFVLNDIIHKPLFVSPITLPASLAPNEEDKFQSALENMLREKKITYSTISKLSGEFYKINLIDSGEVIISPQKDLNMQIHSLQYILSRLTMEGKQFSALDLRFDKPVIVLK